MGHQGVAVAFKCDLTYKRLAENQYGSAFWI